MNTKSLLATAAGATMVAASIFGAATLGADADPTAEIRQEAPTVVGPVDAIEVPVPAVQVEAQPEVYNVSPAPQDEDPVEPVEPEPYADDDEAEDHEEYEEEEYEEHEDDDDDEY